MSEPSSLSVASAPFAAARVALAASFRDGRQRIVGYHRCPHTSARPDHGRAYSEWRPDDRADASRPYLFALICESSVFQNCAYPLACRFADIDAPNFSALFIGPQFCFAVVVFCVLDRLALGQKPSVKVVVVGIVKNHRQHSELSDDVYLSDDARLSTRNLAGTEKIGKSEERTSDE